MKSWEEMDKGVSKDETHWNKMLKEGHSEETEKTVL
jgi:hypothetical protein